jgi:hypothetical protein
MLKEELSYSGMLLNSLLLTFKFAFILSQGQYNFLGFGFVLLDEQA